MAQIGTSGILPGPRPPGRVSSEKNSILGTTHNATRAPSGHSRRGRRIIGEYLKGPYGSGWDQTERASLPVHLTNHHWTRSAPGFPAQYDRKSARCQRGTVSGRATV